MKYLYFVLLTVGFIIVLYPAYKFTSSVNQINNMARNPGTRVLKNLDFEVFGKVQGVFFRKHTKITATKYGLVGWVQNTNRNTVIGQAQGPADKLVKMKEWLRKTGSPHSSISKAEFRNEEVIDSLSFQDFSIIR